MMLLHKSGAGSTGAGSRSAYPGYFAPRVKTGHRNGVDGFRFAVLQASAPELQARRPPSRSSERRAPELLSPSGEYPSESFGTRLLIADVRCHVNIRAQSVATRAKATPQPPAPLDDEVDEFEDYDPLAGFTSAQKRRVMAMKDTQAKYDLMNKEFQKELASLQAKYQKQYGELRHSRACRAYDANGFVAWAARGPRPLATCGACGRALLVLLSTHARSPLV